MHLKITDIFYGQHNMNGQFGTLPEPETVYED